MAPLLVPTAAMPRYLIKAQGGPAGWGPRNSYTREQTIGATGMRGCLVTDKQPCTLQHPAGHLIPAQSWETERLVLPPAAPALCRQQRRPCRLQCLPFGQLLPPLVPTAVTTEKDSKRQAWPTDPAFQIMQLPLLPANYSSSVTTSMVQASRWRKVQRVTLTTSTCAATCLADDASKQQVVPVSSVHLTACACPA